MPATSRRAVALAGVALLLSACSRDANPGRRSLVQVEGKFADAELSKIADVAQAAAGAVMARWGRQGVLREGGRVIVRAAHDEQQFLAWGGDRSSAIAATTTDSAQVLMSPQLCAADAGAQRFVLTHEITHAVLGVRSAAPRWVGEGAAELTAWKASGLTFAQYAPTLAERVRNSQYFDGPPPDADFEPGASTGSSSLNLAYQRACAFSDLLRSLRGDQHYRSFAEAARAGRGDVSAFYGRPADGFATALHAHLRLIVGAGVPRR